MYALVDAVSFYASAEKVFDPSIRNRPVVVLTNNDGCICAVCPMARRLGIPKFVPYFKIKSFLHKHNVVVRSSNYELYADLSEQMMNVIARFCDNQYIYSIDESFLAFKNYGSVIGDWHQYGHEIRRAIWKETRLPVGVGFGITPTLAKAANHAAKKLSGFNGVAVISNKEEGANILKQMEVTDVWGIGNRLGKKLKLQNIHSALDLAQQPIKHIKRNFNINVEQTVNELNGIAHLTWNEIKPPKQQIFSTRSFGERITNKDILALALKTHGSIVGKKLRQQQSFVKSLLVFASNSPHDERYYKKSLVYEFTVATNHNSDIAQAISMLMHHLFQSNIGFYRCGVGAIALESNEYKQGDLFNPTERNPVTMQYLDRINNRFGQNTLKLACEGKSEVWQMRRNFLSPQYTSCWRDIPKIEC